MRYEDKWRRSLQFEAALRSYMTQRVALDRASFGNHKNRQPAGVLLQHRFQSVYAKGVMLGLLADPAIMAEALTKTESDIAVLIMGMTRAGLDRAHIEEMIGSVNSVHDSISNSADAAEVSAQHYAAADRDGPAPSVRAAQVVPWTGLAATLTEGGMPVALERSDRAASNRRGRGEPAPT